MNSQVHLNPTSLSILSIPRSKVWIFVSPILRLLHEESTRTPQNNDLEDEDDLAPEDLDAEVRTDDSNSDYEGSEDPLTMSWTSGGSSSRRMSRLKSATTVDNSSKQRGSVESITDLAQSPSGLESETFSNVDNLEDDDYFFHIAYTPTECTVICSSSMFWQLFLDPLELCKLLNYDDVMLVEDSYLNLQIDSDGEYNNSVRILELTQPLSEHKISLFFLSSHFTDIVLIPDRLKDQVINILTKKNFEFSDISNSYIVNRDLSNDDENTEVAPVEASVNELELNTLKLFKQANIQPKIIRKVKLLLTGARPGDVKYSILKAAECVALEIIPDYFAITRTSLNEISLILPGSARKRAAMGFDYKRIIGSALDFIIPITVDLSKLPLDSTGIVAGLASRIISSTNEEEQSGPFEMNYLSMARAGIIMIPEENLSFVAQVLKSVNYDELEDVGSSLETFRI